MILERGIVRTLDPSLATASALAIAGDRIAGGVGTHETALPGPERIDLGGRCVLPGFTDAHVHFPTWALARREVRLEGVGSVEEAVSRVRDGLHTLPEGGWLRGRGWRSAEWPAQPAKEALDEVAGDVPVALLAQDSHSLWLNSAALERANGELEVEGGVVERDAAGEPTGILREEACWRFRDRHIHIPDEEYVEAMREGLRVAAERGVTAVHDKDGWIGALRFWQSLAADRALTLRVWQSLPADYVDDLAVIGLRGGFGDELLRVGYLKTFMDGTLGSQTARMLDGSCWRRKTSPDSRRSASPPPFSSATHRRTVTWPTGTGPERRTAPMPTARSGIPAPWWPTARMLRSRSSTRSPASAPVCFARWTIGPPGTRSRR
jgi:predicted amidohydrolase YtcJ